MKRAQVPLEQFDIQFSTASLKEPVRAKEVLVTILRFLDKDILPQIEEFSSSLPTVHEITEHPFRTEEDGLYFLSVESSVNEFEEVLFSRISVYLYKALMRLEGSDADYLEALVKHKFKKRLKAIDAIAQVAHDRFEDFVEAAQGHSDFTEDESVVESAVAEAGNNYRTSVDRLLKTRD